MSLNLQSASLDNHGGRIAALTGDALIRTGQLDNRDGGVSAGGLLKVTGSSLLNGGDARGEMVGQRIELGLTGALDNRSGIIESASTLDVGATTLDNRAGQIRALGTAGKTGFQIGELLDNRNGTLETANTDLELTVGNLLNTAGTLLHVGSGNFGVSSQQVMAAGGRMSTRGTLTLDADSWTNSSVLQAGTLQVNVGNFTQSASGQLLATNALIARGGNWHNEGVISSDGTLSLTLGGSYSGNGRLTGLGVMNLAAAQMTLVNAASIAGGSSIGVDINGQLTNHGSLSAATDLTVRAGGIDNDGALAASRDLLLSAGTVLNDQADDGSRGFLFSGRDMTIGAADFTNRYADVYSLGKLLVAGAVAGSSAASMLNSSGSIEAAGDIDVQAARFVNERNKFRATQSVTGGYMTIRCVQHCGSSGWVRGPVFIYKTVESVVHEDSPSGTLVAGHDLTVNASTFLNSRSVISAGNDLAITSGTITNQGERSESGTVGREVGANVKISGELFYQLIDEVKAYDRAHPRSGPFDQDAFAALVAKFDPAIFYGIDEPLTVQADGQFIAPAIIQAGGTAKLSASGDISNVVVQRAASGLSNRSFDTHVNSVTQPIVVHLNAQLPPDLARQQVDPTLLPGFSLPAGQNGLFRLSGQGGNDASVSGQQWHFGTGNVTTQSRQGSVPGSAPGGLQAANAGAYSPADSNIADVAHQGRAVGGRASALGVYAPGDASGDFTLPQRHANAGSDLGIEIPGVTRFPASQYVSKPHKYLIETNPVLTELKQFMSSDYLLDNLGYDPDNSWKRLGDGLYEQRLIQQAVVARTGQQFIDGQTSGEQLYKHLMDNAILSKNELNLSVGVGLTAAQVTALTHDIVWLEEHEVNGEKVLVPVLYLAHANNRLGPDGALIAGQDVELVAGENLNNIGTLRATRDLTATTGNDLSNAGLIEAGGRLDLLAGNNLVNRAGGIISGRGDVELTTLGGDLINQRDSSRVALDYGPYQQQLDYLDNGARIEAGNDLLISAGRDLLNSGSALQAGRDLLASSGRDLLLSATEQSNHMEKNGRQLTGTVRQSESQLDAGRDISLQAGRDFSAIASDIEAKRNITVDAVGSMTLASAANEDHFYSKSKKVTVQEDHVRQVGTQLTAGGDVTLTTGEDLTLVSSKVSAGNEAYLYAGGNIELLAETDSDYSLYDKKSKGSWCKKKTRHDEVTDVRHVGSQITSGGDLTLESGGDQRYQAARLESGNDLIIDSAGSLTFEGVKDLHQESHAKSSNSLAWTSAKGKGSTDESLRQSQLVAKGELVLKAADGVQVDLKNIDQRSVSQVIDAMVQADPELAWLKEAEKRGDVDWHRVKELHDSYQYSHSGLGQGAMLATIIIVSVLTAGAASGALGTAFAGAGSAGSGTVMAAGGVSAVGSTAGTFVAAGWGNLALSAGLGSLAGTGAVSAINNKGNLGAALKDTLSKDSLQNAAISMVGAGVAANYITPNFGGTDAAFKATNGFNLGKLDGIAGFGLHAGVTGVASGVTQTVIKGGSLGDNLMQSLVSQAGSVVAAVAFNSVGSYALEQQIKAEGLGDSSGAAFWREGGEGRIALHALTGGAISAATGGDFTTGAVAAGANQAMANVLDQTFKSQPALRQAFSQLVGAAAAGLAGGDVNSGAWIAQMADQYNRQAHPDETRLIKKEAQALADAAGISPAEAEQRMAQAFAYYTDRQWQEVLTKQGLVIDAVTLDYLARALTPMAADYDAAQVVGDVPVVEGASKQYTPEQTLALLKGYASNHSGYFNDNKMYGEYLLAGKENEDYYNRNLNFGKLDPNAQVLGAGKGIADSVVEQIKGLYGLGEGLVTNPEGTTTGVLHELIKSASNPQDVVKAFLQAEQNADIQARLFRLQGEPGKAAEVEAKWATDFVSTFVAVNGAGKLGQVAESLMKRESAARVATEGSTGAKATVSTEVPATSAIARVGLRDDLAAQAGIPRNIAESPSSMWGKSIDDIKQSLMLDGASLTPKPPLAGTSGKAQVFIVEGHPTIKEVEYHPGGGTHGDSLYYELVTAEKVGTKNIEVRVIDPSPDFSPGAITRYQQYYDAHGNRLKYEGGEWKGWK
ncbi:DUF637 domain-containing protein [Pseudomonas vlassakiae]|uniref:DUF637 domain-containing protein n=1 Tax=Pseudomonas vlassakiae TaxID=485888 RepID=UPI0021C734F9|nr:DUF637 domain-containing protein [Pseudomonas vlassakiae]MCU0124252.1 DUF637 domain-containing protein [Pseudomonas vlassakiae]